MWERNLLLPFRATFMSNHNLFWVVLCVTYTYELRADYLYWVCVAIRSLNCLMCIFVDAKALSSTDPRTTAVHRSFEGQGTKAADREGSIEVSWCIGQLLNTDLACEYSCGGAAMKHRPPLQIRFTSEHLGSLSQPWGVMILGTTDLLT